MLYAKFMYPESGYSHDKETAKKAGLKVGECYKVENVIMGQSYCSVFLKDVEECFNSVQFEYEKDGKPCDIYKDPEYNPYLNVDSLLVGDIPTCDTTTYSAVFSSPLEQNNLIVDLENMKDFIGHVILHTNEKDYVLDFQKLLEDYGIEVKE